MAELAHRHHAWLHVDAAFGLFARISPVTADLAEGIDLADSVIADGHKWLNVPYDAASRSSGMSASSSRYLAWAHPTSLRSMRIALYLAPEMSRRARSLAVWATLAAYDRSGYRAMIDDGRVYFGTTVYAGKVAYSSRHLELADDRARH